MPRLQLLVPSIGMRGHSSSRSNSIAGMICCVESVLDMPHVNTQSYFIPLSYLIDTDKELNCFPSLALDVEINLRFKKRKSC